MYPASSPPPSTPRFVLLLSSLDDEINLDRAALRRAGVKHLRGVRSGLEALRIIQAGQAEEPSFALDFIVCAEDLPDMSLERFIRALNSLEGQGRSVPPILRIGLDPKASATDTQQRSDVILPRPYSTDDLLNALKKLRSNQTAPSPQRIREIKDIPPSPENTTSCPAAPPPPETELRLRAGLSLLRQDKLESARVFLLQALKLNPLEVQAALGLARLYKRRGEEEQARRWLHKAGTIYLDTGQTEQAERIFATLPPPWQGDHHLIEAVALLREEDFDGACEAFMRAVPDKKKPLHALLGRACQFTPAPERFMRGLCDALERRGFPGTAHTLDKRLLEEDPQGGEAPGAFTTSFPTLHEILAVMRFTLRAWRAGEVYPHI